MQQARHRAFSQRQDRTKRKISAYYQLRWKQTVAQTQDHRDEARWQTEHGDVSRQKLINRLPRHLWLSQVARIELSAVQLNNRDRLSVGFNA